MAQSHRIRGDAIRAFDRYDFRAGMNNDRRTASDFAYILRIAPDGTLTHDWISPDFQSFTGYELSRWEEGAWGSLVFPDDRAVLVDRLGVLKRGAVDVREYRMITASDEPRWVRDAAHFMRRDASGDLLIVGGVQDITEQRRTEASLRESAAQKDAILNTTVDGIVTINERGVIETFNPAAERLFGYSAGDVIGKNVRMLMPEPYRSDHDGYLRNYMVTGEAKIIGIGREVVGRRKDETTFPMDLAVSEGRLTDRRIFTGIVRDLTERKRLERELIEISDREQRRIGQDLHDGLGQMLAGIGFLSKSLETRAGAMGLAEAADARQIAELVAQAISQARGLARGLHPVELKDTGLMTGLEELAANVENIFRVGCRFCCDEPVLISDNAIATHLYRIIQEAVNNAIKHGKSRRIVITLGQAREAVMASVEDDGVGFPTVLPEKRGLGLRIMQYRAGLIGASIAIRRGPAGGTTVSFSFPYPPYRKQGDTAGIPR